MIERHQIDSVNFLIPSGVQYPEWEITSINKFQGTIDSVNKDEINTELIIDIGNSDKIASVITTSSFERLKIGMGTKVSAIIKASDVIIGK